MIGVGLAAIVVGVIFLFVIPWAGIAVGVAGLVLMLLFFAGFGRGVARDDSTIDRRT